MSNPKNPAKMKKTFRMMGLCALAMLAVVSCKKNEQQGSVTIKANIAQLNNESRTEIGPDNWLVWKTGDQIKVYTADKSNSAIFTTNDNNVTQATFSGNMEVTDGCYAFYPAEGVEYSNGSFKLRLSGTQTFVDGNFANNTYPMYATCTGNEFYFDSPYGVLALPLCGSGTVSNIVLRDNNDFGLCGYYSNLENIQTTFFMAIQGSSITLNCGDVELGNTPKTFCFVVPANVVFGNGFTATVNGTNGVLCTLSTTKNNSIAPGAIRTMPLTLVGDGSTVVTGDTQAVPDQPTSITLQATYIVPDSLTVTEVGFYYGTDSTNLTTKVTAAAVESPFSYTIDSLTAGATYYYRAYIKIGGNETRGGLKSFSTLAHQPSTSRR